MPWKGTSPKRSFHVTTPAIRKTDNPRMAAVGLLNVEGCYNSLLSFIDKVVDEGFISPAARRIIVSARNANQLVRELE
ncbi:cytokinin riboside 5'-monophosphate phosphoribohydrolase LOG7-like protein, partial [Tanacetum coccineum]